MNGVPEGHVQVGPQRRRRLRRHQRRGQQGRRPQAHRLAQVRGRGRGRGGGPREGGEVAAGPGQRIAAAAVQGGGGVVAAEAAAGAVGSHVCEINTWVLRS